MSPDETFTRLGCERIDLRRSGQNRLFLFGKLDGRKQSILVDSGWSYTTINPVAAKGLSMQTPPVLPPGDPFVQPADRSSAVTIGSLVLGSVAFTNQPARIQDLVFDGKPAPFDVVVGCDFLMRHSALIDCAGRRLYVRGSATSEGPQKAVEDCLLRNGFEFVDLKRTKPLALICPLRLNGEPREMLVDTGAVWSCLDADAATRLGLKLHPTPRQMTGAGSTGQRGFAVAQVKKVELGGSKMGLVSFAALPLGDWGLSAPDAVLAEVAGILGGPELAAWNAIIDCSAVRLWFKQPSARR